MATPVTPTPKVEMDPNFEKQINARASDAKKEHEKLVLTGQVPWDKPEEWDGDPHDWEKMKDPFKREKANDQFEEAVKDPESPGTSSDLIAATTQIDYLAVMERAFRARHTMSAFQFARPVSHHLTRKRGHGDPKGPFKQAVLQYVRGTLGQGSGGS